MSEHGWIQTLFILILEFQFTGASDFIRHGEDVTLTCENMRNDQNNCDRTTWIYSVGQTAVTLFELGKIHKDFESISDRLSLTVNCSLVIKKVTEEDVGRYTCRKFNTSGRHQGSDSVTELSVVTMTEHKNTDMKTLKCSVTTHGGCDLTVKWLYHDKDDKTYFLNINESHSPCNSTIQFLSFKYQSESFTCEVTERNNKNQFIFSRQPPATTTNSESSATTITTQGEGATHSAKPEGLLRLVIVSVGLTTLILTVVAVKIWIRTKGDEGEDEGSVKYENVGDPSASVRLH